MQLKKKKKKEREALGDKVSFLSSVCCYHQSNRGFWKHCLPLFSSETLAMCWRSNGQKRQRLETLTDNLVRCLIGLITHNISFPDLSHCCMAAWLGQPTPGRRGISTPSTWEASATSWSYSGKIKLATPRFWIVPASPACTEVQFVVAGPCPETSSMVAWVQTRDSAHLTEWTWFSVWHYLHFDWFSEEGD